MQGIFTLIGQVFSACVAIFLAMRAAEGAGSRWAEKGSDAVRKGAQKVGDAAEWTGDYVAAAVAGGTKARVSREDAQATVRTAEVLKQAMEEATVPPDDLAPEELAATPPRAQTTASHIPPEVLDEAIKVLKRQQQEA